MPNASGEIRPVEQGKGSLLVQLLGIHLVDGVGRSSDFHHLAVQNAYAGFALSAHLAAHLLPQGGGVEAGEERIWTAGASEEELLPCYQRHQHRRPPIQAMTPADFVAAYGTARG